MFTAAACFSTSLPLIIPLWVFHPRKERHPISTSRPKCLTSGNALLYAMKSWRDHAHARIDYIVTLSKGMNPKFKRSKTSRDSLDANTHPPEKQPHHSSGQRENRIKTAPKTEVALSNKPGIARPQYSTIISRSTTIRVQKYPDIRQNYRIK